MNGQTLVVGKRVSHDQMTVCDLDGLIALICYSSQCPAVQTDPLFPLPGLNMPMLPHTCVREPVIQYEQEA